MIRSAIRNGSVLAALLAAATVGVTSALATETPLRPHPVPTAAPAQAGVPTPLRAHPAAPVPAPALHGAATVPARPRVLSSAHPRRAGGRRPDAGGARPAAGRTQLAVGGGARPRGGSARTGCDRRRHTDDPGPAPGLALIPARVAPARPHGWAGASSSW